MNGYSDEPNTNGIVHDASDVHHDLQQPTRCPAGTNRYLYHAIRLYGSTKPVEPIQTAERLAETIA